MTDMKRITVSLPEDMDKAVLELRKQDTFVRCSYSEIIRKLLTLGLSIAESEKPAVETEQ